MVFMKGTIARLIVRSTMGLLTLGLLVPSFAFAQSAPSPSNFLGMPASAPQPAGLSSCFDYYRFGSVPAEVNPALATVAQSSTIGFSGNVTNENAYPIQDATVYVKIFHARKVNDNNGPDVVDLFPVASNVTLAAKQVLPLSFTWKVPKDADVGQYQIATFVTGSDRYELSGLVFSDDVTGSITDFQVVGSEVGTTRFVKSGVTINNQPFGFTSFPPTVPAGVTNIPVRISVSNDSASPYNGSIAWSLYYWDDELASHLITQSTVPLKVHPEASTTLTYMVTDTAHSVYYLKGEMTTADGSKSFVGVRFVRDGVNEPRFNFVALDGNTAVACVHSTGTASAPNSQVKLTVTRNAWYSPLLQLVGLGSLASASYSGDIPGAIYALTAPLKSSAGSYVVHATLYQSGKEVDAVSETYTCKELGTSCTGDLLVSIGISILIVVIILIVVFFIYRARKRPSFTTPPL